MRDRPPKKIIDSVVSQLLAIRKEQKLSHEKTAQLAKLHRSTISLTENRKFEPTLLTLLKIASALGVSLGQLIVQAEKEQKK